MTMRHFTAHFMGGPLDGKVWARLDDGDVEVPCLAKPITSDPGPGLMVVRTVSYRLSWAQDEHLLYLPEGEELERAVIAYDPHCGAHVMDILKADAISRLRALPNGWEWKWTDTGQSLISKPAWKGYPPAQKGIHTMSQHPQLTERAVDRIAALRQAALESIDRMRDSLRSNATTDAARRAADEYRSLRKSTDDPKGR